MLDFYVDSEIDSMQRIMLDYYFGLDRASIALNLNQLFSESDLIKIINTVKRLKKREPLAYILGEWEFYGLTFKVDENTLIPRPETEELVDWILKDGVNGKKLIDIGTGSGCIPISIALNSSASVSSLDVSELALEQARSNSKLFNTSVNFIHADILKTDTKELLGKYDLIVSNPPYVLESDKKMMTANVLANEPHLALFVSDVNALIFYEAIAEIATEKLNNNGLIYFEIHEFKGVETIDMLRIKGFTQIELRKDMQGKDRMVKAVWKL